MLQKHNIARGIVFGTAATGEFLLEAKPATPLSRYPRLNCFRRAAKAAPAASSTTLDGSGITT